MLLTLTWLSCHLEYDESYLYYVVVLFVTERERLFMGALENVCTHLRFGTIVNLLEDT